MILQMPHRCLTDGAKDGAPEHQCGPLGQAQAEMHATRRTDTLALTRLSEVIPNVL